MTRQNDRNTATNLPQRLRTFQGFWNDHKATAHQLAAIGHVYDRPPLEAFEEGSRCVDCSAFVKRELSIRALEGPISSSQSYVDGFESFAFHLPSCDWHQVRIPLEPQAPIGGLHGFNDIKNRFERRHHSSNNDHVGGTPRRQQLQTSSLFSLPTEIRLQIYAMVLPRLDNVQEIVPLNRDSARIVTSSGYNKSGPRDLTKANLLRTCRTLHNEALDILFTGTTFKFSSTKIIPATRIMYLFLRNIGKHGRELLKGVDVHCGAREDAISFALLGACPKMRAITIRLGRPVLLFPRPPPWVMEGMASLLNMSGLEEVRFADCGPDIKYCLIDPKQDATIVRRELTRPKDAEGTVRWVDGRLDL